MGKRWLTCGVGGQWEGRAEPVRDRRPGRCERVSHAIKIAMAGGQLWKVPIHRHSAERPFIDGAGNKKKNNKKDSSGPHSAHCRTIATVSGCLNRPRWTDSSESDASSGVRVKKQNKKKNLRLCDNIITRKVFLSFLP